MPELPSRKLILQHFDMRDALMAGVIRQVGAFKLSRNRNYYLVLCRAIIGQQISTKAAESISNRFVKIFKGSGVTPERVQSLSDNQLREIGLSKQKVRYIKDLSVKFLDGTIRSHRMPYMRNEEIIQQLTGVYGIGPWTAEMFLIFSLNRLDVLPVGDLGLKAGLKKIYNMRALPAPERVRALGKKWHPFETIGTWYTWRTLDEGIVAY
ncbi:MAG: DNA-3-methyladenine glycosylase 2 family protein [Nitrospina sp.]|jgi:DNA-3-methyladenine glycosylase II|nr:DNA-3-methyladenine glycosylase 2 family protein [Nitrospina sp.]MBT3511086.1 DNA-3-methyladenine glycosylase 2 family protein [Nitrospina sp.]MBT3875550.1 DNA-3-methyladenine glycosylase 2 family protein [Nitrospina sp.]MBT4047159.1 DNA-3-methyladenine glycosylase 2 family protein [Nitrospina sp.]MBT4555906.1 DNA-3-methyladenine glycosylase 2 family protein [Nitrospina sp.]